MIKTHTFNGVRYEVYIAPLQGVTDAALRHRLAMYIRVGSGVSDKQLMDTAIHEALHACNWDKREATVETVASDITCSVKMCRFNNSI